MTTLRMYGTAPESIVDGPGLRFSVFVQGCTHHCPGCHNPESQPSDGGYLCEPADIVHEIHKNKLIHGVTLTGGEPFEQVEGVFELAQLLTPWCGRLTVHIVPFTEIQEQIRMNCPEDHFTLIMRRFMMRIAEAIGRDHGAKCLVTGENLGQVASQTMDAMAVTGAVVHMPIFHPLIGMDKEEIVTVARRIGTLETSILPYEDCCTVFTPKHPKTKPVLAQVEAEEQKLDVEGLIARAIANTEKTQIRYYEDEQQR